MLRLALEDGKLDAVIAGLFDFLEHWEMLLGDVRRPQQQIEAQKHGVSSRTGALTDGGAVFIGSDCHFVMALRVSAND
jgi:hypothetical protein